MRNQQPSMHSDRASSKRVAERRESRFGRVAFMWAVAAVLAQACATGVMTSAELAGDSSAGITITIANESSRSMRLYLHAGTAELPLGTVPPLASRTFKVPTEFAAGSNELQIEARERGTIAGFRSERFTLGLRRDVRWTLNRANSTPVTVR